MRTKKINLNFFKPVKTLQDWKEIEKVLSVVHPVRFVVDGYKVRMHLIQIKMKLVIILLIDERFDPDYWQKEAKAIVLKFFHEREYYCYTRKSREAGIKTFGLQVAKEKGYLDKAQDTLYYWISLRSLRKHLQKTCKEIMVCKADLLKTIGDLFIDNRSKESINED
jgi:hypothetical protein